MTMIATSAWTGSMSNNQYIIYTSPAGTELTSQYQTQQEVPQEIPELVGPLPKEEADRRKNRQKQIQQIAKLKKKGKVTAGSNIPPKVFFKFVKSKLDSIDQDQLQRNLDKLVKLVVVTEEIGQQALFEEFSTQLAIAVREQEASAAGYNKRIELRHIQRFIKSVTDRLVKFKPLEEFPRVIPSNIMKEIKHCQDLCIFDEFHVLFIDHVESSKENEELKTNKQKVKEKDPILFGAFKFQPDVLYYIVDWIDEYCDLSFRELLKALTLDDPTFELSLVQTVNKEYVDSIVKEVHDRVERLKKTRPSNFKDLMAQEEQVKEQRKKQRATTSSNTPTKKEDQSLGDKIVDALKIPFGRKKGKANV
jgi:hypothetical protein